MGPLGNNELVMTESSHDGISALVRRDMKDQSSVLMTRGYSKKGGHLENRKSALTRYEWADA